MPTLKYRIESKFESAGRWVYDNKFKTLFFVLILIVGFFSQLKHLSIDTSSEGFLHDNDPTLIAYNEFREQFGRDEVILLAIKTPDVFQNSFLEKLTEFHNELEENVPFLDDMNSLINARNTRGEGDSLIVEDLFETLPGNMQEMQMKKELVLNSHLYSNLIISEDAAFTAVMIQTSAYSGEHQEVDILEGFDDTLPGDTQPESRKFLTDAENSQIVNKVAEIVSKYRSDDFEIYSAGSPVVINAIKRAMQHDMQTFTKFSLLTIAIILFFLFRRVSGVFMPLIVVILTLLSTFATMAATGTAIKLPTQILPSFLLAVGVAASVHLLAVFFRYYNREANKREAIAHALGHSGLAIAMTGLTTAASLLSFSASEVAPIADLGKFAAAGVLISLIYTLILIPALIALLPIKHKQDNKTQTRNQAMDKLLLWMTHISTTHHKLILSIAAIAFVVSLFGLMKISFYHNPLKWLPESWESRQATELVDEKMKGSGFIEVVINTGEVNGLYEPAVMQTLESINEKINTLKSEHMFVGKTISVLDILKESNRALNENNEDFYRIPTNKQLIAQELLLFENSGSDDLEDFVDSQLSMARLSIKTPWADAASNARFVELIEAELEAKLNGQTYYVTGMGSLFSRTLDAAINSTKISYVIAVIVITFMMIALLGHIKLGLVSMIPNLLPILFSIGIMGYFAMPLDMFTMLIGSIAIGLVVDDTIHFMHNFQRYFHRYGNVERAVQETLLTTGRAIVVTTIVLCLGFFIFMAASMENVFRFGLITGTTIILALLADLFLAPALMKLIYGKHEKTIDSSAELVKEN